MKKSYSSETNVKICAALASTASADMMNRLHESRGCLEGLIKACIYPPGEYVISRKAHPKKTNQGNWANFGIFGYSYEEGIQANLNPAKNNDINYMSLWFYRVDGTAVLKTTHDNDKPYLALRTATLGLFSSKGQ